MCELGMALGTGGVLRPLRTAEENLPGTFARRVPAFPPSGSLCNTTRLKCSGSEQPGSAAALVLMAQERWERAMKYDWESCGWWDEGFS